VGKTTLIKSYCHNEFDPSTPATLGASFVNHTVQTSHGDVNLMLWDTAGEERFRAVAPCFLRGANGVVLVYDLTSDISFNELSIYLKLCLDTCKFATEVQCPVMLLGNKADLPERAVMDETVVGWMDQCRIPFHFLVSAKTRENIEKAFEAFAESLAAPAHPVPEFRISAVDIGLKKSSCC
jgi:small GTP-binding protein